MDARYYRALAAALLRAAKGKESEVAARLREHAEEYLLLAETLERLVESEQRPVQEQPIQQQQQVQSKKPDR